MEKHDKEKPVQPAKELVRKWLKAELEQRRPPPDPEQIRRELGWDLLRLEREPLLR
ncbi:MULTISPECIES: hypothetical protein [unclassified Janthinobacterium]|jgi:hypothetical protein|uniref:hypothetical protein n=1 Tax=unclassified Janthinobacterium TaxID=2610881 RepID=UPI000CC6E285|nr:MULTISPECIES: hypothetical protein [unclassified Janthinobacterium]PKV43137.1 hypothetical protein CLU92_0438 [Janthinobacterium sp. 61]TDY36552.1 hypothetical protein C8C89_4444 [Janthinobacterium sp. 75]